MKKYLTVSRINFRYTTWIAYMVALICSAAMVIDMIIDSIIKSTGDTSVTVYDMLYLVCLLAPVFIASVNYSKLMNIGVKKKSYFFGCMVNYIVLAAVVSLLGVIEWKFIDPELVKNGKELLGLIDIFGWGSNVFTAFFSQFAFLLLLESVVHTLTFMQTKWYGWAADGLIVAIISVFTPIEPLRNAEGFFFYMVIFSEPYFQIPVCLGLAIIFYLTNLFYLKKRSV